MLKLGVSFEKLESGFVTFWGDFYFLGFGMWVFLLFKIKYQILGLVSHC
jgi:hypothetical protein